MPPSRTFEDKPATRERVPLLIGLVGPSGSGKTYSALRLAAGIQRVTGGEIFFVDTEAKRALHYSDLFKFRHVVMDPPFGPLDYLAAIEHCMRKGARVLVVDSLTHEHNGEGGVMDQSEKFLAKKCGDDEAARRRNFMMSLIAPKVQRRTLNSRIVQLGINGIFCYRAHTKIKPIQGREPENLGWAPETTSPLVYEMAQQFLLEPGSDGVPTFKGETEAEKALIKSPAQFRDWFKQGQCLDEDMGERMAKWAAGGATTPSPKVSSPGESTATAVAAKAHSIPATTGATHVSPRSAPSTAAHGPEMRAVTEERRKLMVSMHSSVSALRLGMDVVREFDLHGKEREEAVRKARLEYVAWVIGRKVDTTNDCTDDELDLVQRRADLGEVPPDGAEELIT